MMKPYFILLSLFIGFSATAQQYRLDSIVHTVKGKQFIASQKYDAEKKLAEIIRYQRENPSSEIQKVERTQVQYDEYDNELQTVFASWNPVSNIWDEDEKTEQEFNGDNKLTRMVTHRKKNNEWAKEFENIRIYAKDSITQIDHELREEKFQPTHKNITIVNSHNKVKYYGTFLWNNENQNWRQFAKTENEYKDDTVLTGYASYEWKDNQWQNQEKVVYEFDQTGQKTGNYTTYIQSGNDWTPIDKLEHIELPEMKKKISRIYKWSETDNDWIVRSKKAKEQSAIRLERDTLMLHERRPPRAVLVVFGLFILSLFVGPIVASFIYVTLAEGGLPFGIIAMYVLCWSIALLLLRIFLWNAYGKEVLCLSENAIDYRADYLFFVDGKQRAETGLIAVHVMPHEVSREIRYTLSMRSKTGTIETVTKLSLAQIYKIAAKLETRYPDRIFLNDFLS